MSIKVDTTKPEAFIPLATSIVGERLMGLFSEEVQDGYSIASFGMVGNDFVVRLIRKGAARTGSLRDFKLDEAGRTPYA